jgi:hypothetical protein
LKALQSPRDLRASLRQSGKDLSSNLSGTTQVVP